MTRRGKLCVVGAAATIMIGALCVLHPRVRAEIRSRIARHSVASRLAEFEPSIGPLWRERCERAGLVYPPARIVLVGLKRERQLRVHATADSASALLATYPFTAASGTPGPKLREGDGQVPEGIYSIESLNPNSRFHLSLRVGYPSDEDRRIAVDEGRTNLGGDIMIHGGAASIGCIAIGDAAIEEVFVLAAVVGVEKFEVLLCPSAAPDAEVVEATPSWVAERYRILAGRLRALDYNAPE